MKRRDVKRSYQFLPITSKDNGQLPIKTKPHRPARYWLRRLFVFSPYILAIILIGYLVLFSNIFQISKVDVQGPSTVLSEKLQAESEQFLLSRLFGKNWLFLSTETLKNNLQKTFSGQEAIIVTKSFPNKLTIKTDEQKTAIVWKTGSQRYVISVNGRAMSEIQPHSSLDMPTVVDTNNIPIAVGSRVASREFIEFVTKINTYIKDSNLGPEQISIAETTGEIAVKTNAGYFIRFNTAAEPDSQIRALKATLELLGSQNKKPTQYIDMRIEGKAFYI